MSTAVSTVGRPRSLKRPRSEDVAAVVGKEDPGAKQANRDRAAAAVSTAREDLLQAKRASRELLPPRLASAESEPLVYAAAAGSCRDLVAGPIKASSLESDVSSSATRRGDAVQRYARQGNGSNGQVSPGNGVADEPSSASVNGSELSTGGQRSASDGGSLNGTECAPLDQNAPKRIIDNGTASVTDKVKCADSGSLVTAAKGSQHSLKTPGESDRKETNVPGIMESPNSPLSSQNDGGQTLKCESAPAESPSNSAIGGGPTLKSESAPAESPSNSANGGGPTLKSESAPAESPSTSANGGGLTLKFESAPAESPSNSANSGGPTVKSESAPAEPPSNSANGTNSVQSSSSEKSSSKPPNVVVYCGKKDSSRKFDIIKTGLERCLNTDAYTIYLLPHDDIMTLPWEDNAAVLIISHDYLHDNISRKCADFLKKGGKVVSFGSSMEAEFVMRKEVQSRPAITQFTLEKWRDGSAIQGRYCYVRGGLKKGDSSMKSLVVDPKTGDPLVVELMLSADSGSGRAIFSQVGS